MEVKEKVTSDPDVVDCLKELPFYNKQIKKLRVKRLKILICFLNFLFMKECNKNKSIKCNKNKSCV